MEKQTHSFNIGNNKRLVLEVDPQDKHESEFVKDCEKVAKAKPSSIQEFFVELERIQRTRHERTVADDSGRKSVKG